MALTHTVLDATVVGNRRLVFTETLFDASYNTGGEAIAASDFSLTNITAVIVLGAQGVTGSARYFQWDRTNSKLVAFDSVTAHTHTAPAVTIGSHTHTENTAVGYTQNATTAGTVATGTVAAIAAATASAGSEVASTTDLSLVKVNLLVLGN